MDYDSRSNSGVALLARGAMESRATLIPGLPNDVAATILSKVPYSHHSRLKRTCKTWKYVLSSKWFLNSLNRNHLLCIFPQDPSISSPFLFDPNNLAWCPLPPMPCNSQVYSLCNFAAVSLGPHLYVLGGSVFDARSFPIDRPSPSSSTFRFNFHDFTWEPRAPMISPRGSFACAAVPSSGQIIVAGGGSRHKVFSAAGSRIRSAERYDVKGDRWESVDALPSFRAGCVGFVGGEGREFWVMGGYGASRTISGVFPVDEYHRDAVAMGLEDGVWREVGDMWGNEENVRVGKIAVVDDHGRPAVFMLDGAHVLRYEMSLNRWLYESSLPRKTPHEPMPYGFVALDRELYVVTHIGGADSTELRPRHQKRAGTLHIQIYNPEKKTWRPLSSKSPIKYPVDISSVVLSSICI